MPFVVRFALAAIFAGITTSAFAQPKPTPPSAPRLAPLDINKAGKLVGEGGREVTLRGVNFGCWLLPESHFMGMKFEDEKALWGGLEKRLSKPAMEEIREAFRTAWIDAKDFERVRELGMNHVRVPFNYRLLEDDAKPGKYLDAGWKWLDRAVEWSEAAGIYCVLDLHGAPGGQSTADHTGEKDRNALWASKDNQARTAALWAAIARRYKGRSAIAAFDLLNEPMGPPSDKALTDLYNNLIAAVQRADPNRIVMVEDGYRGLSKLPKFSARAGILYSVHVYPTMHKQNVTPELHTNFMRDQFPLLEKESQRLRAPLYIGEWNVIQGASGGGDMMKRYATEMDKRGWSWAMWIYKQVGPGAVYEWWSLYRNQKNIALPDFEKDDKETILKKMDAMRTENLSLYEPMKDVFRKE